MIEMLLIFLVVVLSGVVIVLGYDAHQRHKVTQLHVEILSNMGGHLHNHDMHFQEVSQHLAVLSTYLVGHLQQHEHFERPDDV